MRPAFLAAGSRAGPGRAAGRLACVAGRRLVTDGYSLADAGHVVTAGLPGAGQDVWADAMAAWRYLS
jgi:hypothetical protein